MCSLCLCLHLPGCMCEMHVRFGILHNSHLKSNVILYIPEQVSNPEDTIPQYTVHMCLKASAVCILSKACVCSCRFSRLLQALPGGWRWGHSPCRASSWSGGPSASWWRRRVKLDRSWANSACWWESEESQRAPWTLDWAETGAFPGGRWVSPGATRSPGPTSLFRKDKKKKRKIRMSA